MLDPNTLPTLVSKHLIFNSKFPIDKKLILLKKSKFSVNKNEFFCQIENSLLTKFYWKNPKFNFLSNRKFPIETLEKI